MPETLSKIIKNGLLPLLLGCGLFFINIRPYHDWGDDFSQYLQQARNLEEGLPIQHTTHVKNPDFVRLGPEAYPPMFPLLLTISNYLFKDQITGGQYLVSAFLLLFGWAAFLLFLKRGLGWPVSLLLMLTLIYHPWTLGLKSQVLSEFPFAFFITLSLLLLSGEEKQLSRYIAAGLVAGLAILTRSAGWILPVAGLAMAAMNYNKKNSVRKYLLFAFTSAGVAVITNLGMSYYASSNSGYSAAVSGVTHELWSRFTEHLTYYIETLQHFIEAPANHWGYLVVFIQAIFWVGLILGIMRLRKQRLIIITVALYLLMLLVFPFKDGFRFLIPVIPLLLLLSISGAQSISGRLHWIWVAGLLLLNISYQPQREYILSQQKQPQAGPQIEEAQEVFEFIKTNVGSKDLILFSKPRALAYYTQKPASSTRWRIEDLEFKKQAQLLGANYFLQYTEIEYSALNNFVKNEKDRLTPVFRNDKFALFKLTD